MTSSTKLCQCRPGRYGAILASVDRLVLAALIHVGTNIDIHVRLFWLTVKHPCMSREVRYVQYIV